MALPDDFMALLRTRVPLSSLVQKRVKLVKKGNRMNGLCPFHNEKTPSFYVNDDDGFYHCFGCQASGDAITYLREQDGMSFMEAVRHLAELAGVEVPNTMPADPARSQQRAATMDILEASARYFAHHLNTPDGAAARAYLDQRGLGDEMRSQFRLGYAPPRGLLQSLQQRGFSPEMIIEAGLAARSDRDGSIYESFRNRIIFPIEDRQGKVIGFGGRAMGDAMPKYLNSSEGPVFSKKMVLYGWGQARQMIRAKKPLLVVEGYMDVIAVTASGLAGALAPLGTALTDDQIKLLWRLSEEPILCFDGDAAGQKAAMRAIERCLPVLEPGKTVRIATLPDGKDPDDILKEEGREGFARILESASGLMDALWSRTAGLYDVSDPSGMAAFWQHIRNAARQIVHNQTRTAYMDEIEFRIRQIKASRQQQAGGQLGGQLGGQGNNRYGNQRYGGQGYGAGYGYGQPMRRRPATGLEAKHKVLLALLLDHPAQAHEHFEELSALHLASESLENVKNSVLDQLIRDPDLDAAAVKHHVSISGHESLLAELAGSDIQNRLEKPAKDLAPARAAELITEMIQLSKHRRRR
ncbi:MAG: DNA primase [Candidatus Puniceispirillaceae bacterium]